MRIHDGKISYMEKVICVVVTYNRKELLAECLDALLAQTRLPEEIIVFNNCSSDKTEELFEKGAKYDREIIKIFNSEKNLGGAGGFSEGMRLAAEHGADWVWLMDDDCIAQEEALEALLNSAAFLKEKEEAIGFLASCVYGVGNVPINVPRIDDTPCENGYPYWYKHLARGIVAVKEATFVSLLIPSAAIKAVGYPLAQYFIWGDDAEYTRRIVKEYAPAFLCAESRVLHKRKDTNRIDIVKDNNKERIPMYRYHYRNALLNSAKYDGKGETLLRWLYYFALSFKCLLSPKQCLHTAKFAAIQRGIWMFIFRPVK